MESASDQTSDMKWETIEARSASGRLAGESPTFYRAMNGAASRASRFLFAARV